MHQQDVRSVGVWIRVSTEDQAKGDSPATHKARAEQYAQFKGWSVAEVYDLSGVSGKAVMDHPEAKRMLDDVRTGRISALVFSKLARLARSTKGLLEVSEFFREHNADLISLQESIDTTTPSGRLFYTMIAGLAEWEREEIVDRVKAAVVTRAKMGRKVAGAAPYGYHWVGDEFLPHPDEAPVRALAYELFAEYQRKGTVARILNERGFRTRRGNKFSIQSIQLLLVDPAAKGLRRCNYTTADQRGGKVSIKPEDEWEWHPCEAIVAPELWERCNAILKKQREGRSPGPRGNYLFSGKVKCEADGETMYVLNESPKFVCRKCRRKIPQDDLEAIFRDRLRAFFASPEELADFLKTTLDEVDAKEAQIQALEKERSQLGRDREKLLRGYLDEEVEATRFTPLDKEMGERIDELALGIAAIEGEVAALRVTSDSSEEIISGARTLYDRWDELTFEQKRSVIEAITDQIVIGERDIAIHLHYVPSQQDDGNYMKNTFDFVPAATWNWSWAGDPDGQFAAAFQARALNGAPPESGVATVHYHPAFLGV
jgi:site-specific DNA recombinase